MPPTSDSPHDKPDDRITTGGPFSSPDPFSEPEFDGTVVTVASYRDMTEALAAVNLLEAEGIECRLADQMVLEMDWLMGNAIGGVKLQTRDSDADRALELLQNRPGLVPPTDITRDEPDEDEEAEPKLNEREENASRAWRAMLFGLIFWPLLAYAFALIFLVYLSDEPLRPALRKRSLIVGCVFLVPVVLILLMVASRMLDVD